MDETAEASRRAGRRRGTAHAPAEQRRTQILDAAVRCFAKSGYERATMDDVAESAGLSKGSLYRFFESKDEILLSLFEHFEARIGSAFEPSQPTGTALATLRRYTQAAIELLGSPADLTDLWAEFFAHRGSRARMSDVYERSRRRIAATIRAGIDSGEIRDLDPMDAATAVLAALEGLVLQGLVDPRFDALRRWPGVWGTLESGLRRTP